MKINHGGLAVSLLKNVLSNTASDYNKYIGQFEQHTLNKYQHFSLWLSTNNLISPYLVAHVYKCTNGHMSEVYY